MRRDKLCCAAIEWMGWIKRQGITRFRICSIGALDSSDENDGVRTALRCLKVDVLLKSRA